MQGLKLINLKIKANRDRQVNRTLLVTWISIIETEVPGGIPTSSLSNSLSLAREGAHPYFTPNTSLGGPHLLI